MPHAYRTRLMLQLCVAASKAAVYGRRRYSCERCAHHSKRARQIRRWPPPSVTFKTERLERLVQALRLEVHDARAEAKQPRTEASQSRAQAAEAHEMAAVCAQVTHLKTE